MTRGVVITVICTDCSGRGTAGSKEDQLKDLEFRNAVIEVVTKGEGHTSKSKSNRYVL